MAFDAHGLLAYGIVATAPSPATSGTSLVLQSGEGAGFPTPPFNATLWPSGVAPIESNAEIVRVTNISTDTLTITRTQEGSVNQSVQVGWQIANTMTPKVFTDIENQLYGAYKFSAYRANTLTPSTTEAIVFDTKVFDTGTNYSISNGEFVAPLAGYYQFNTSLSLSGGANDHYYVMFYVNGSENTRLYEATIGYTTNFGFGGSSLLKLNASDYVQVYIGTTGAVTVNTGQNFSWFNGYLMFQT